MCWGTALPSWLAAACVALAHPSISSTALALATRFAPGLRALLACCHRNIVNHATDTSCDYSSGNMHGVGTNSCKSALEACSQMTK